MDDIFSCYLFWIYFPENIAATVEPCVDWECFEDINMTGLIPERENPNLAHVLAVSLTSFPALVPIIVISIYQIVKCTKRRIEAKKKAKRDLLARLDLLDVPKELDELENET